jgi:hypothetical protein
VHRQYGSVPDRSVVLYWRAYRRHSRRSSTSWTSRTNFRALFLLFPPDFESPKATWQY